MEDQMRGYAPSSNSIQLLRFIFQKYVCLVDELEAKYGFPNNILILFVKTVFESRSTIILHIPW